MAQISTDVFNGQQAQQNNAVSKANYTPINNTLPQQKPGTSLKGSFFMEDIPEIGKYILNKLLIPAVKRFMYDSFSQGVSMWLFGKNVPNVPTSSYNYYTATSPVNVQQQQQQGLPWQQYQSPARSQQTLIQPTSRARSVQFNLAEVTWETQEGAEQVFNYLQNRINQYHVVSVMDFLEASDLPSDPQDEKFGWYSLSGSMLGKRPDGKFYLDLPPTIPIKPGIRRD